MRKKENQEGRHQSFISQILNLETRAARVEGIFAANPELANQWRSQAALIEACRSVAMEDIHVFEGDVIFRHLENRITDAEASRGAALALDLIKVLRSPGMISEEPERVLSRCWRAAGIQGDDAGSVDLQDIARTLSREMTLAPTPILGALRASIVFRTLSEARAPCFERLLFMVVEHDLRGGGQGGALEDAGPASLIGSSNAAWVACPSVALTQERFRAWSPMSSTGVDELFTGISEDLGRTLGSVPVLKRWRDMADAKTAGSHGKSKLKDLVALAAQNPLLTAPFVKDKLNCSDRASLYLMKEAQDQGIVSLVTPRKTYRVWAVPHIAQLLKLRAAGMARSAAHAKAQEGRADQETDRREQGSTRIEMDEWQERSARALEEMDAAMAKADAILAKYGKIP